MQWFPNYFDDIGFMITFVGFVITIWQIIRLQNRQTALRLAVNNALRQQSTYNNISLFTKSIDIISDIKSLVIDKKYSEADKRIAEIKESLFVCEELDSIKPIIQTHLQLLSNHQSLINKAMLNARNVYQFDDFLTNLDEIRDTFTKAIIVCKKHNG